MEGYEGNEYQFKNVLTVACVAIETNDMNDECLTLT